MIIRADARHLPIKDESVQMCVTSPPYWGLRDYGTSEQLGLEKTPEEYVANMLAVFREVRRVLKDDGVLWLNLGDSYAREGGKTQGCDRHWDGRKRDCGSDPVHARLLASEIGLKQKDLVGIPWRVAFALQADGWYLRSDIIWSKPNPMPESVTDRPTKAHEYIFLMSKEARYYYNAEAIKEEAGVFHPGGSNNAIDFPRTPDPKKKQDALGKPTYTGFNARYKARKPAGWNTAEGSHGSFHPEGRAQKVEYGEIGERRNKRTVWSIATQPYPGSHFATFPEEIPRLCILAGSKPGDVVLDPFGGSGCTAMVALKLGRKPVHIDLTYHNLAKARCSVTPAMAGLMG